MYHRFLHRVYGFLPGYAYLTFEIITVCMCVSLVELPLWIVMGWVSVLEYMLPNEHGLLCPGLISTVLPVLIWYMEDHELGG
jgi:hypothetical protein